MLMLVGVYSFFCGNSFWLITYEFPHTVVLAFYSIWWMAIIPASIVSYLFAIFGKCFLPMWIVVCVNCIAEVFAYFYMRICSPMTSQNVVQDLVGALIMATLFTAAMILESGFQPVRQEDPAQIPQSSGEVDLK